MTATGKVCEGKVDKTGKVCEEKVDRNRKSK
jgi:hypothetical protein